MLYGREVWDPVLICAQIVAVQCLYYLGLGLLMSLLVGPYAPRLTLHHMFDWRWVSLRSFQGWMVAIAFLCNAFVGAGCLRLVVQRAKKCLDYAATIYVIHVLAVTLHSGFPTHLAWWVAFGVNFGVTAAFGEFLCVQQELKEIPLASIPRQAGKGTELTSISTRK